ncbi:hypothetical protein [Balneatrix alpica]|uniref:Uncharacterized protein n=1 Tax=Balneatrix alpica TaxID=75684 RepID=A0ABV5Z7W1_9GAMM|nr:hypothetical protein [Balneatrix alpica]
MLNKLFGLNSVLSPQQLSLPTQSLPAVRPQPMPVEAERPSTVVKISKAAYEALAQEQQQHSGATQAIQQNDALQPTQQGFQLKPLPAYLFQVADE